MNDIVHIIYRLVDGDVPGGEPAGLASFAGPEPVEELAAVPARWPRGASPPRPLIRPSLLDQVFPPGRERAAEPLARDDGPAASPDLYRAVARDTETARVLVQRLREDPQVDADSIDTITRVRFMAPLGYETVEAYAQGYLDDESRGGIGLAAMQGLRGWLGDGVELAVVEGGWQLPHPDLPDDIRQPLLFGYPVVLPPTPADRRHGNNLLGVLVGRRNGTGINGIVPEAGVAVIRYGRVTDGTEIDDYNIFEVIAAALCTLPADGGGVLVLAADAERTENGRDGALLTSPRLPLEAWEPARRLFRQANAMGHHVVIAAGNGLGAVVDDHCAKGDSYPSGALIVGAGRAHKRQIVSTSNRGRERVDLHSWGHRVATCDAEGYTDNFNGTSSATAIVAGVVALLASHFSSVTGKPLAPDKMRRLLADTGYWNIPGIGPRPNLRRALQRLRQVEYDQGGL